MLHLCVQKFDVTNTAQTFLGTKRSPCVSSGNLKKKSCRQIKLEVAKQLQVCNIQDTGLKTCNLRRTVREPLHDCTARWIVLKCCLPACRMISWATSVLCFELKCWVASYTELLGCICCSSVLNCYTCNLCLQKRLRVCLDLFGVNF